MIDKWIRSNSKKKYDNNGNFAKWGKLMVFFEQFLITFLKKILIKKSLDVNDFDISFAGAFNWKWLYTTITEITAEILSKSILENNIYICGNWEKINTLLIDSRQNFLSY